MPTRISDSANRIIHWCRGAAATRAVGVRAEQQGGAGEGGKGGGAGAGGLKRRAEAEGRLPPVRVQRGSGGGGGERVGGAAELEEDVAAVGVEGMAKRADGEALIVEGDGVGGAASRQERISASAQVGSGGLARKDDF